MHTIRSFIFLLLFLSTTQYASAERYEVTVEIPGTLSELLPSIMPYSDIYISGEINGIDIKYIKQCRFHINTLDLEHARIVTGGEYEDGLTSKEDVLGKNMFQGGKIDNLILPASTKYIEPFFCQKGPCKSIEISAENPYYTSKDGLLLTKDGKTLIAVCQWIVDTENFETGNRIGKGTFYRHFKYRFTFFDSVQELEDSCCLESDFTFLGLGRGIQNIGNYAFYKNNSILRLDIPASTQTIGHEAFSCSNLLQVVVRASVPPTMPEDGFVNYNATLYVPQATSDLYLQSEGWRNFSNIIELKPETRKMLDGNPQWSYYTIKEWYSGTAENTIFFEKLYIDGAEEFEGKLYKKLYREIKGNEPEFVAHIRETDGTVLVPVSELAFDWGDNTYPQYNNEYAIYDFTQERPGIMEGIGSTLANLLYYGIYPIEPEESEYEEHITLNVFVRDGIVEYHAPTEGGSYFTTYKSDPYFGELVETGITSPTIASTVPLTYDLSGRRMPAPALHGVFIEDGKRVVR